MDTVTAEANINTMQACFYWRSNLGGSLWSHVTVEVQYSGFYPELCSCACQVEARSPERTSTGTPPLCWYNPGCSSLLQHTRPHLEQTRGRRQEVRDREMLASSSRRVNDEFRLQSIVRRGGSKVKNSFTLLKTSFLHFLTLQTHPDNLETSIR